MTRFLKLAIIFLSVSLSTTSQVNRALASADIECQRKTQSTAGFTSVRALNSWFPETVYFHRSSAKPQGTDRLRFAGGYEKRDGARYSLAPNITWEMLADGRLFGMLGHTAGFVLVTPIRYICQSTVEDILGNR